MGGEQPAFWRAAIGGGVLGAGLEDVDPGEDVGRELLADFHVHGGGRPIDLNHLLLVHRPSLQR